MLWQAEELIAATGGEMRTARAGETWGVEGLSIDSREISSGDLFIALKAARDGHEFVKTALEKGAAGALVSHIPDGLDAANLLVVDDVEAALTDMAKFRRSQVSAKIVAITGSAGKTSTKEMMIAAASAEFSPLHASVKSFNNHWGVPLSLARMPKNSKLGVFEIGMNHPGEIAPLVAMVKPDIAMITNIASVHLAGFENERGIAREKASILTGLSADGRGVVFGDMMYHDEIRAAFAGEVIYYGIEADNPSWLCEVTLQAHHSEALAKLGDKDVRFRINEPGRHHLINALGVLTAIDALEGDLSLAVEGLATWQAPSGRGEEFALSIGGKEILLIDESFNANPLSMRASIASLGLREPVIQGGRKIAVLGDMAELGENERVLHADLADLPEIDQVDQIYTVGKLMQSLYEALPKTKQAGHFQSVDGAFQGLIEGVEPGDIVMVKSSKSSRLSWLVEQLKAVNA